MTQLERTNKPVAELMIKLMEYVITHDYYPADYFNLLELKKDFSDDKITDEEFMYEINELKNKWK